MHEHNLRKYRSKKFAGENFICRGCKKIFRKIWKTRNIYAQRVRNV